MLQLHSLFPCRCQLVLRHHDQSGPGGRDDLAGRRGRGNHTGVNFKYYLPVNAVREKTSLPGDDDTIHTPTGETGAPRRSACGGRVIVTADSKSNTVLPHFLRRSALALFFTTATERSAQRAFRQPHQRAGGGY